jgi:hypothetical protein
VSGDSGDCGCGCGDSVGGDGITIPAGKGLSPAGGIFSIAVTLFFVPCVVHNKTAVIILWGLVGCSRMALFVVWYIRNIVPPTGVTYSN